MVDTMSTAQNQNVQLIKTFIVAFAAMLFAIPVVAVVTTSIVKAQFASIAHAAAQPTQSNSISAGPSCEVPADEQQANSASHGGSSAVLRRSFAPVNQSNTTNTTTNTTNTSVDSRFSGNSFSLTDNRFSGNSYTDNRFSGNTVNDNDTIGSNNTTASNNNTAVNSGNTVNNVNTNVNSGNTVVTDNDGIDVL